jgi:hypothetical protein
VPSSVFENIVAWLIFGSVASVPSSIFQNIAA